MIQKIVCCFFCLAFAKAYSQSTDLFRAEYTYFPQRNSDNTFRRFRVFANVPLPLNLGEGVYLAPYIEYRNVHLTVEESVSTQINSTLNSDRYESFELSLGYTFPMKKDWRFGTRAGVLIASNFDKKKAISDDYFASLSFYFIKNKTKRTDGGVPWRLVMGVQYSTTAGRPFPLPYVNYYREFASNWSYSLGVPKMNLKYRFNKKHDLQLYARLDGFYANIQNNIDTGNGIADNVSMRTAMMGPGYHYHINKYISAYVYIGYTIFNDIRLRNTDAQDIQTINDHNSFYSRAGIKVKI